MTETGRGGRPLTTGRMGFAISIVSDLLRFGPREDTLSTVEGANPHIILQNDKFMREFFGAAGTTSKVKGANA